MPPPAPADKSGNDAASRAAAASAGGPRLLADIGGTNARFAWQRSAGAPIEALQVQRCADHASPADAARAYLQSTGRATGPEAPRLGAIAIATSVHGDEVAMTNHHWRFSIEALRLALGLQHLHVLNDFTALALALPALGSQSLRQVGGGSAEAGAAKALIGPGTGLGVGGLLPAPGGWVPLQSEGGHVTLAASDAREQAVLAEISRRHGHVSAERAVSGAGLAELHRALGALEAPESESPELEAADITRLALAGDARCTEALDLFCAFLGQVAGNLALTLGARGGVYIGGGIVPRITPFFERSPFRARFEAKGRMAAYLAPIPVYVIEAHESPALLGAAIALDAAVRNAASSTPEAEDPA